MVIKMNDQRNQLYFHNFNDYPHLLGYSGGHCQEIENAVEAVAKFICTEGLDNDLTITTPMDEFVLNTIGIYIDRIADMNYRGELLKTLIPMQKDIDGTSAEDDISTENIIHDSQDNFFPEI